MSTTMPSTDRCPADRYPSDIDPSIGSRARSRTRVHHAIGDRPAFGCLIAAIVWAPWPLGSNRPWAVALLAVVVWAGLLAASWARVRATATAPADSTPVRSAPRRSAARWLPLGALLCFALLQVIQLVPGWGEDGAPISIDPFHTRYYLLTTAVYLGAWLLVWATVNTDERAIRLLAAVVLAGALQAMAAVMLYSTGSHYTFLFAAFDQGSRATATFPSPDNLAGYLELGLSAALGWMLSRFGQRTEPKGRGWRANTVEALAFVMSGKMLLRLVMVVMVVALVMTHSRMGNSAFFIALSAAGLLVAFVSSTLRKPALYLVVSMIVVDVIVIGQWVGLDRLVERMQDTAAATAADRNVANGFGLADLPQQREESIQDRLLTPRLSLKVVAQRPWLGHGGGSYPVAFPPFKIPGVPVQSMYWDHAHDDYVQVACDMGLLGLAFWLAVGLSTLWRCTRLLGDSESRATRGVAAGALMAMFCMGIHSIVDYNLHIPAIALTFTVMLAAAWAVPISRKRDVSGRRSRSSGAISAAASASDSAL